MFRSFDTLKLLVMTLTLIIALPASAANSNVTYQEGRVNINRTFQCGDVNENVTYQSGEININRTIQRCTGKEAQGSREGRPRTDQRKHRQVAKRNGSNDRDGKRRGNSNRGDDNDSSDD